MVTMTLIAVVFAMSAFDYKIVISPHYIKYKYDTDQYCCLHHQYCYCYHRLLT